METRTASAQVASRKIVKAMPVSAQVASRKIAGKFLQRRKGYNSQDQKEQFLLLQKNGTMSRI